MYYLFGKLNKKFGIRVVYFIMIDNKNLIVWFFYKSAWFYNFKMELIFCMEV